MDIATALRWGKKELRTVVDPLWAELATPELDAELLLAEVLNVSRPRLFAHNRDEVSTAQWEDFQKLTARRAAGEPIAHLLGKKEFFGLEFAVNSAVLTPRPETEILVEIVLQFLQPFSAATVIDVGTGSGAIALALAAHLPATFEVHGVELSRPALEVARENARALDLSRVDFAQSDLLKDFILPIEAPEPIVMVANLPYIPLGDNLPVEVTQYEPLAALFSGADGLTLYRRFFAELKNGIPVQDGRRRKWDACFFEFHPPQQQFFTDFLVPQFPDFVLSFRADLAGKVRFGMLVRKDQVEVAKDRL